MNRSLGSIFDLGETQQGLVARWQMTRLGYAKSELDVAVRRWERVARGVYAVGELTDLSPFMAAALTYGPNAVISHVSALMLLGMRPMEPGDIHVSVPHMGSRLERRGTRIHRRRGMQWGDVGGIPVTSPTQSLLDADLEPYALYRSLEAAERRGYPLALRGDVVRLKRVVRGYTRSDAEAMLLMLCHERGLPLPLVNHLLHGVLVDFHWPRARLVLEVDGWEFHSERPQFEEDRRRELVHTAAGERVFRASATHVKYHPDLVAAAIRRGLADARLRLAA